MLDLLIILLACVAALGTVATARTQAGWVFVAFSVSLIGVTAAYPGFGDSLVLVLPLLLGAIFCAMAVRGGALRRA